MRAKVKPGNDGPAKEIIGQHRGVQTFRFGRPSRITAVTSIGREGVIHIECEAELGGATHNKGVRSQEGLYGRPPQSPG